MGPYAKPLPCPSLTQVLGYDFAIRKMVALLMNSGVDIRTAFGQATADSEVRQTQFTASVGVAIGTAECRALSAPGLREAHALPMPKGAGGGKTTSALALVDAPPAGTTTKSQALKVMKNAKKARLQAEKAAADKAAKRQQGGGGGRVQMALQNGGVVDGGCGGTKGGGKAGKKQRKVKTGGGLGIRFAYNNGKPCSQADCPRAHVCQICEGQHPMSNCPNK